MSDYKDVKGYIIIFFCNHDPYSQLYEDRVIALHRKFAPSGFPVIAINPNSPLIVPEDSYEEMIKRSKERKYPFAYLYDGDQQLVYPKFGIARLNHAFVVDKDLILRYSGAIDDFPEDPKGAKRRYVEDAINALLRGEIPDPSYTRAVGTTVKKKPK